MSLPIVLVGHLLKSKKEFKNLRKKERQNIFTDMNWIKPVFSMIWLIWIVKI